MIAARDHRAGLTRSSMLEGAGPGLRGEARAGQGPSGSGSVIVQRHALRKRPGSRLVTVFRPAGSGNLLAGGGDRGDRLKPPGGSGRLIVRPSWPRTSRSSRGRSLFLCRRVTLPDQRGGSTWAYAYVDPADPDRMSAAAGSRGGIAAPLNRSSCDPGSARANGWAVWAAAPGSAPDSARNARITGYRRPTGRPLHAPGVGALRARERSFGARNGGEPGCSTERAVSLLVGGDPSVSIAVGSARPNRAGVGPTTAAGARTRAGSCGG